MNTRIYCTACLLLPLVGALAQPAATEEGPETQLFDTGNPLPSAGMPTALPATTGWKLVPEETTTHPFSGSAVILNDKLAITFTEHSRGPNVYSRSTGKPLASVALSPTSALEGPLMTGWQILENSASGVKMECVYLGNRPLRIRLTTGESIVELQSPKLKRNLEVRSDSRFTVVSDYFGDDLVYPDGSYLGALPAENFCLNLLGDGDAILMSVWQSNQQEGWLSKYDAAFGSSHTGQLITALQDKNAGSHSSKGLAFGTPAAASSRINGARPSRPNGGRVSCAKAFSPIPGTPRKAQAPNRRPARIPGRPSRIPSIARQRLR